MTGRSEPDSRHPATLEVEAAFDPSILGLSGDEFLPRPDKAVVDRDNHVESQEEEKGTRRARRVVTGKYEAADWSPPRKAFRRSFGLPSGTDAAAAAAAVDKDKDDTKDRARGLIRNEAGIGQAPILIEEPIRQAVDNHAPKSEVQASQGTKEDKKGEVIAYDYASTPSNIPGRAEQAVLEDQTAVQQTTASKTVVRRTIRRRPGRPSRRAIRVVKPLADLIPTADEEEAIPIPPHPIAPGPLASLHTRFGSDVVERLRQLAITDLTEVRHLPTGIRDLLVSLGSGPTPALEHINDTRLSLGLPILPLPGPRKGKGRKKDEYRLGLQRVVARMRGNLYTQVMANLTLAEAPELPARKAGGAGETDGDHTTTDEELGNLGPGSGVEQSDTGQTTKQKVDLTSWNLRTLAEELPARFPSERKRIRAWAKQKEAKGWEMGDQGGRVVWTGSVGKVIKRPEAKRKKEKEGATRKDGKIDSERDPGTTDEETLRQAGDRTGQRSGRGQVMVFVDHSNILHGLISLLSHTSHSAASTQPTKAEEKHLPLPPLPTTAPSSALGALGLVGLQGKHDLTLSLPALHFLLLRGRRPFTLSHVPAYPSHHPSHPSHRLASRQEADADAGPRQALHLVASSPLTQSLDPLVRLDWECSVLKRVEVREDEVEDPYALSLRLPKATGMDRQASLSGGATTDGSAGNGAGTPRSVRTGGQGRGIGRWKEQGVDEVLHLKILQGLNWWDRRERVRRYQHSHLTPSQLRSTGTADALSSQQAPDAANGDRPILVLATGDAATGQFTPSGGFLSAAEEALERGWDVELWSWRDGLSWAWKGLRRDWGGERVQVHELDRWVGALVDFKGEGEDGDGDEEVW